MFLASWPLVTAMLGVLLLAPYALAATSSMLSPYDFCYKGEGAICGIYSDLRDSCEDAETEKFLECQCDSGYVAAIDPFVLPSSRLLLPVALGCAADERNLAYRCQQCLKRSGQMYYDDLADIVSESCKEGGYTIAPIPASYSSDIKERTKTAVLAKLTSTWTPASYDYTSVSVAAKTSTLHGLDAATITLPPLVPPTGAAVGASPGEGEAARLGSGSRQLMGMLLVAWGMVVVFGI